MRRTPAGEDLGGNSWEESAAERAWTENGLRKNVYLHLQAEQKQAVHPLVWGGVGEKTVDPPWREEDGSG